VPDLVEGSLIPGSAALAAELAVVQAELAAATQTLEQLERDLAAVAAERRRRLGPLYARLAEVKHALLMAKMRDEPLFAKVLWEQARKEFEPPVEPRPAPDDEVRGLWRTLVKRLHPDLASDPDDRHRREEWMKRLTHAWSSLDVDELRRIESLTRAGTDAERPALKDELAAVRAELVAVQERFVELVASDVGHLLRRHRAHEATGSDYFLGLEADLELQIFTAEQELQAAA
jgi:hypothetical protein